MLQIQFTSGAIKLIGCFTFAVLLSSCGFLAESEQQSVDAELLLKSQGRQGSDRTSPGNSGKAATNAPEKAAKDSSVTETSSTSTVPLSTTDNTTVPVATSTTVLAAASTTVFTPQTDAVVDQTILTAAAIKEATTVTVANAAASGNNWIEVRSASGRDETNVPLQFGRPFAPGEIKSCPQLQVGTTLLNSQADVKTRHADGSVKFAIISVLLSQATSTTASRINVVEGIGCNQAATPTATLLALNGGFDAQIVTSGQSASARSMLSSNDFKAWTQGPVATTLILADHKLKKYDVGSGATKLVRPSFEVQFWPAINQYRVRFIGETTDTEKVGNDNYDLSLRLGLTNRTVYTKPALSQIHSSRWTKVFWSGTTAPPELNINWNVSYLAATKALPNYDASISLSTASEAKLVSDWQGAAKDIQDLGFWTKSMPATGGRADLGPFTKWSVAWLYSGSAQLKAVALGTADLAGAWPMHLREGNSTKKLTRAQTGAIGLGMPVSFYARPSLSRPGCNGYEWPNIRPTDRVTTLGTLDDKGWFPDTAHQPDPFFVPYLLTGEHFYLEQMQFWATFSAQVCGAFGTNVPDLSDSGQCWARSVNYTYAGRDNQIRAQAWALRSIVEAAWATPNVPQDPGNQALAADFAAVAEDKIVFEEGLRNIVRGTNNSRPDWKWANSGRGDCNASIRSGFAALRTWDQTSGYPAGATYSKAEAGWQIGFVMYVLNRATELGAPAGSLRSWLAPWFIEQVNATGANPYHLADYVFPTVKLTGTPFQTWSEVDAAIGKPYDGLSLWTLDGSVKSLDQGYGTVAITALASSYGETGAATAWSNFAQGFYRNWGWANDPKWALIPR